MKPRDLNGAINRAETVYVLVQYNETNTFYARITKPAAKEISYDAKSENLEIDASVDGEDLYIGFGIEAGDPVEEMEEEEEETEEEDELEDDEQ